MTFKSSYEDAEVTKSSATSEMIYSRTHLTTGLSHWLPWAWSRRIILHIKIKIHIESWSFPRLSQTPRFLDQGKSLNLTVAMYEFIDCYTREDDQGSPLLTAKRPQNLLKTSFGDWIYLQYCFTTYVFNKIDLQLGCRTTSGTTLPLTRRNQGRLQTWRSTTVTATHSYPLSTNPAGTPVRVSSTLVPTVTLPTAPRSGFTWYRRSGRSTNPTVPLRTVTAHRASSAAQPQDRTRSTDCRYE